MISAIHSAILRSLASHLELRGESCIALRSTLNRPARRRILHFLSSLAFLIRHRATRPGGGLKFGYSEIERHAMDLAAAFDVVSIQCCGATDAVCRPRRYDHARTP
jgi:hypothetical protein